MNQERSSAVNSPPNQKISVIMPAYNSEKYVGPAIGSIRTQTLRDFEFIIVDDGSTDRTLEIIESHAAEDDRIRVVHGHHEGVSAALNAGLEASTCEWVAVMHSDDVALPRRLEAQWNATQTEQGVVIWGTNGFHINSRGKRLGVFRVGPTTAEECARMRVEGSIIMVIHPTALLHRATALRAGGYDSRMDSSEDIELFDRMLRHGDLRTIDEPLLEYRIHSGSLTMRRYLHQMMLMRYVLARIQHRKRTGAELSFEDFTESRHRVPRWKGALLAARELPRKHYRCAALSYGEDRMSEAVAHGLVAITLNPLYTGRRVWNQFLSPSARCRLR